MEASSWVAQIFHQITNRAIFKELFSNNQSSKSMGKMGLKKISPDVSFLALILKYLSS